MTTLKCATVVVKGSAKDRWKGRQQGKQVNVFKSPPNVQGGDRTLNGKL